MTSKAEAMASPISCQSWRGGMTPLADPDFLTRRFHAMVDRIESVRWAHEITRGCAPEASR